MQESVLGTIRSWRGTIRPSALDNGGDSKRTDAGASGVGRHLGRAPRRRDDVEDIKDFSDLDERDNRGYRSAGEMKPHSDPPTPMRSARR